jgi:hypothetical protein
MMQYMLSVQAVNGAPMPPTGAMQAAYQRADELNTELQQARAWVFAGRLHPPSTATVVRLQDGERLLTDGPFAEGKEHVGGFWVIKAPDLDAALDWAAKAAEACAAPVEVRPFQDETEG